MAMSRPDAEAFAAEVLVWLTGDQDRFAGFLGWSGESPDALRARIQDPDLLLAVIEFLVLDEARLMDACGALNVPPETPMRARAALPGGADMHWT